MIYYKVRFSYIYDRVQIEGNVVGFFVFHI